MSEKGVSEMSLKRLNELRRKRGEMIKNARAITDVADTEKRSLTDDEEGRFNKLIDDATKLKSDIENEERLIELERENAGKAGDDDEARNGKPQTDDEKRMNLFRRALSGGARNLSADELRSLSYSDDSEGGFTAVEQWVNQLIKNVDDMVFIRPLATVIPVRTGGSLGAPSLDADPEDAEWTGELGSSDEDTQMAFGKRSLEPKLLSKRVKISSKLIRASALNVDQLVRERLAYKFGITQEKAFLTGSGAGQPLGVFTASNDGIPTSRDISEDNTATAVTADGLLSAKYGLKAQYQKSSQWVFHRDAVKRIAKLKDLDDQYIWQPGLQAGQPDRLLNLPLNMSEYAPNTFTTGLYVGLLGDFKHYWIADALNMVVQVLTELYAETNQIGYIGRMESDGMPVLAEAFVRVKLG